jgi:hypothetical protein
MPDLLSSTKHPLPLRSSTLQSDFIMDSPGGGAIRSSLLIFPDVFQVVSDGMAPSWG